MKKTKFDGILNISGGSYEELSIDGVCNCSGDLQAELLDVDGILNCEGALEVTRLDCDGVSNVSGGIRAERIEVDGIINIGGKGKQKMAKVEANEIYCNGVISCKGGGEISADILEADGFINATEIVGDRVVIRSKRSILMRWLTRHFSRVDTIEATTVELHEVTAQTVNGRDIHLGPGCVITALDCSGTLHIDASATVTSISGDYTRV
jgi:hypothetical protein